jgi:hypothetical protein
VNRHYTLLGWLLVAAGFAAIGAGWAGVQSTTVVPVQLAFLTSGGVAGFALVVVGSGLLRLDDVRATRAVLEDLRTRFDDMELDVADARACLEALAPRRPVLEDAAGGRSGAPA